MRKEKGKDPAFLFYAKDWLAGTFFMTYEQKGRFIDLLSYQHVNEGLSYDDIMKVLEGVEDDKLMGKFEEMDGKLFNRKLKRIEEERKSNARIKSENGKKGAKASAKVRQNSGKSIGKSVGKSLARAVEDEDVSEESSNTITSSPQTMFPNEDSTPAFNSLDDLYNDLPL